MLRLHADKFIELSHYFGKVSATAELVQDVTLPKFTEDQILPHNPNAMRGICEEIGLRFSVNQIDKIKRRALTEQIPLDEFTRLLSELESRLSEELSGFSVLVVAQNRADFYEQPNLFGETVFNKFPLANFDIEEAGKCFAMARYTACVMHLQRVTERALGGFGRYLNISGRLRHAQPSWQELLNATQAGINTRTTNSAWTSHEEQMFAEGVQSFLVAVKTAWRNPSMHAGVTYTEEQAEDVYNAVKGFMRHIATHLDESGTFTP